MKRFKKTLILSCCSLILLLVSIVGIERFFDTFFVIRVDTYRNVLDRKRFIPLPEYPPESEVYASQSHEKPASVIKTDTNGFISSGAYHKDAIDIVFLGGAMIESIGLSAEYRIPHATGLQLEEQARIAINTYNGGVHKNNSLHSILALTAKVLPLKPEVVVFAHNLNDLTQLTETGDYWTSNPKLDYPTAPIQHGSEAFGLSWWGTPIEFGGVRKLLDSVVPALHRQVTPVSPVVKLPSPQLERAIPDVSVLADDFSENLRTFAAICRSWDIVPVLLTPIDPIEKLNESQQTSYALFNDVIRQTALEEEIQLIEVSSAMQGEPDIFGTSGHLNIKGASLVSQLIADELEELVQSLHTQKAPMK